MQKKILQEDDVLHNPTYIFEIVYLSILCFTLIQYMKLLDIPGQRTLSVITYIYIAFEYVPTNTL